MEFSVGSRSAIDSGVRRRARYFMRCLLAAAIRLHPTAWICSHRGAGFNSSLLCALVGEKLSARCKAREGQVSLFPSIGLESFSGERMGPRASAKARWWFDDHSTGIKQRRRLLLHG